MADDVMEYLRSNSGSRYPAFRFERINDVIKGRVISQPKMVDFTTEGRTEKRLVIELEALPGSTGSVGNKKDNHDVVVGENVTVFVKGGFQAQALNAAVSAAGATSMGEGDIFAMRYVDTKDTGKMSPAKVYEAEFKPAPARTAISASMLGDD